MACDDPDCFNIIKDLTTFANFTTRPSDLMNPTHICVNLFNDLGKAELKSEKFDVNGDCIEMFNHVVEFKSEGSAYTVNGARGQVSENALGVPPASELSMHEGRPRAANPGGRHSNCHHLGGYPTLSGAGMCLHLRLSTSCITSLDIHSKSLLILSKPRQFQLSISLQLHTSRSRSLAFPSPDPRPVHLWSCVH